MTSTSLSYLFSGVFYNNSEFFCIHRASMHGFSVPVFKVDIAYCWYIIWSYPTQQASGEGNQTARGG